MLRIAVVLALCGTALSLWMPAMVDFQQRWGYVDVRPHAHLFWWLYSKPFHTHNRPLILWLQGGPGASSTGLGNFQEIGPLDEKLRPRNATWLHEADLLFIDNPVGAGFSYVTDDKAYTTNVDEIAADLLTFFTRWLNDYPQYRSTDFYMFCESYGGKMVAVFAKTLYNMKQLQAIKEGKVDMQFRGVALGDSWISAMDYVNSWAPYLNAFSFIDGDQSARLGHKADECQELVSQQAWFNATDCWGEVEEMVEEFSNGVSFYNVMQFDSRDDNSVTTSMRRAFDPYRYLRGRSRRSARSTDPMDEFMNGPVRKRLGIIPDNVIWHESSNEVFDHQYGDFMKPVIDVVDYLVEQTNLNVSIYSGQLDLICDVLGTEAWMDKMRWWGMEAFRAAPRQNLFKPDHYQAGFFKTYRNLRLFWILDAGHMVPTDNPEGALQMVRMILGKN